MTAKPASPRRRQPPPAPVASAPVVRRQDWPTRLFDLVEQRRTTPFAYGRHDCCLFACDGILATTGLDPAAKMFRGKYRGTLGAVRLVKKHGGVEALVATVCTRHGFPEVPVALARRGDVVLADRGGLVLEPGFDNVAVGLCVGDKVAFAAPEGITLQPLSACRRAWRIG